MSPESAAGPGPKVAFLPDNLACLRCGYNLRGLSHDGACPECGEVVAVSLRGDHLAYADRGWVSVLSHGAGCLRVTFLCGFIGGPMTLGGLFLLGASDEPACAIVIGVVGALLALFAILWGLVGVYLLTMPEPNRAPPANPLTLGRCARGAVLIAGLGVLMAIVGVVVGPQVLGLIGTFTAVAATLLALPAVTVIQARALARRLHDKSMADTFTNVLGVHGLAGLMFVLAFPAAILAPPATIALILLAGGLWFLFLMASCATMFELTAALKAAARGERTDCAERADGISSG